MHATRPRQHKLRTYFFVGGWMGYNTTGTRTRNSDARGAQQTRSTRELRVGPARAGTKESAMIHGFEEMSHGFEECHDSWYRFWLKPDCVDACFVASAFGPRSHVPACGSRGYDPPRYGVAAIPTGPGPKLVRSLGGLPWGALKTVWSSSGRAKYGEWAAPSRNKNMRSPEGATMCRCTRPGLRVLFHIPAAEGT